MIFEMMVGGLITTPPLLFTVWVAHKRGFKKGFNKGAGNVLEQWRKHIREDFGDE